MSDLSVDLTMLYDQLDGLLERHLDLLDEYQKAHVQLRKHLSEGFLSLAHANFKCSGRRRYGQDDYDQRMKALLRCHVDADDANADRILVERMPASSTSANSVDVASNDVSEAKPMQQPSPPSTPLPESDAQAPLKTNGDAAATEKDASPPELVKVDPGMADPLRWFGMLVPRELRITQSTFSTAMDAPLMQTANAARGMREMEVEIGRLRKAVRKAERSAGVYVTT